MVNANIDTEIVDYAAPLIKMDTMLKELHQLCLYKNYEEAIKLCPLLAVETRILSATLAIMGHKHNG